MRAASAFDTIFDKKVGQGTYQLIVYFFMGLTALADEAEMISLSVVLPALKIEWDLSDNQVSLLGGVLFFGVFLGSICIGAISDRLGRKAALLMATSLQFVFGVISSMTPSFGLFVLIRGILGFMIGCTVPLAPTFITEISTTNYRGKGQVLIQAFFVIGTIYAMILSKIFLDDFSGGNWRALLAFGALPSLLVFIGTLKYIKESPRFLIAQGKVERGVSILNYIGTKNQNGRYEPVTSEERIDLINWQHTLFSLKPERSSWTSIFGEENRRVTSCLVANWFGLSFNFFGMVFILPFVIKALSGNAQDGEIKGLDGFFISILGEIPAIFIAYLLIDKKSFGRRNTTLFSHLLAAIMFGLAYFCEIRLLILATMTARIFTKMPFITINPLTAEMYPTNIRTIAMGVISGIGRLGATTMPIVTMALFNGNPQSPFLGFAAFAVVMAIATALIPYEPLGRQLDNIEKNPDDVLRETDKSIEISD